MLLISTQFRPPRCRTVDQYCCGHTCCYKDKSNEEPNLFESWYFW